MKQTITFRPWVSRPSLEIEIPEDTLPQYRIRAAVASALASGANLRDADLSDADLRDADLRGANLRGADLRDADLRDADLRDADLRGANLRGADLRDADLRDADLRGANLSDADLRDADLRGANLSDADLRDADLRGFRTDLFDILLRAQREVPGLLLALREGRIDGSFYTGECACLVGTIANIRGVNVNDDQFSFKNGSRPAERWFLGIKEGDTPETNQISKIAEGWVVEFMGLIGIADGKPQEA